MIAHWYLFVFTVKVVAAWATLVSVITMMSTWLASNSAAALGDVEAELPRAIVIRRSSW